MHKLLADKMVASIRTRVAQGDNPTEPAVSVENLEDLVLTLAALSQNPGTSNTSEEAGKWHDIEYLMNVIDAAIEDGFDPDEDGPLLDEIRAEVKAGKHRLAALASSERSGREAVVCSVKTMKLSDGREDHFVSIRVGDREITPYRFTIKGRAEFEVAELNWLLNGAEKPDILDWLDRTRDPNDPTEAAIRNLAGTKTNG